MSVIRKVTVTSNSDLSIAGGSMEVRIDGDDLERMLSVRINFTIYPDQNNPAMTQAIFYSESEGDAQTGPAHVSLTNFKRQVGAQAPANVGTGDIVGKVEIEEGVPWNK